MVNTNQFKNGMHIELDGEVWRIVEFQHVKPGKGGAFVRTKLKSLQSGSVVDKTFRAGEKFNRIRTETKNMQYLYDSGDDVVFMDEETFDQLSLPHAELEDELPFMQPSSSVQVLFALGRLPGWIAQWEEMLTDPEQKIARPRQLYVGADERPYVPIADR